MSRAELDGAAEAFGGFPGTWTEPPVAIDPVGGWEPPRRSIGERSAGRRVGSALAVRETMDTLFSGGLVTEFASVTHRDQLSGSLAFAARHLGFDHFALAYDRCRQDRAFNSLLLHDYPDAWAEVYVAFGLGGFDPIRRASEHSLTGFEWSDVGGMIPLMQGDRRMLSVGRDHGLADGYTVPRHLPGEASGTCTFVVGPDRAIQRSMLYLAEIVGGLALVSAQRLLRATTPGGRPRLTERQRECLLWWARGRSSAEIAIIMGITEETVAQHLKISRERYGVHSRQGLILCALYDGWIGFGDVLQWWQAD